MSEPFEIEKYDAFISHRGENAENSTGTRRSHQLDIHDTSDI